MKAKLFDTQEKIDTALASLKTLLDQPGWKLLEEIIDANIEVVGEQILNGVEGETKENIDRLRDKLKVYKEVRNTPQNMIDKLESQENKVPEMDPFETVESLRKARGEAGVDRTT